MPLAPVLHQIEQYLTRKGTRRTMSRISGGKTEDETGVLPAPEGPVSQWLALGSPCVRVLASLPNPPVWGCEGRSPHLVILNLITPPKSLFPHQVTLTDSRDEDLDVLGSQYSSAPPAFLQCDR